MVLENYLLLIIFVKSVLMCAGVDVAIGPFVLSPPPKAPYQPRKLSSRAGKTAVISSSPYKTSLIDSLASKTVATPSSSKKPSKKSNKQSERVASKSSLSSASKGKGKLKRSAPTAGTASSSKRRRKQQQVSSSSDDEDEKWPCVVCGETFSRPREVWLHCQECKLWAHRDCTAGDGYFICPNCDSDDEIM